MPKRFYVHEVFTEDEIKKSDAMQTAAIAKASSSGKASDLYRSILQGAFFVKSNSENSQEKITRRIEADKKIFFSKPPQTP